MFIKKKIVNNKNVANSSFTLDVLNIYEQKEATHLGNTKCNRFWSRIMPIDNITLESHTHKLLNQDKSPKI